MIKKRKRTELYDKFRQGAIPSGADFADLIRSQVNLLDDGIDISEDPSDPVCFRAHGEKENILDFSDTDGQKRWRISGLCEDGSKEGLNIQSNERSKLYIERETGNLGINTEQPAAKLHIIQNNAANALRIEDESNDTTPFVVSSEGQVGIGVENPKAKLHVSFDGAGDVMRVDDTNEDTTPFIIDEKGFVGIGCEQPKARLTIMDGGISIGKNDDPGANSLFVAGDLEVVGNIVVAGGQGKGGIVVDGPIRASAKDFYIEDNVFIIPDPGQTGANGNLSVAGDTTLGTFKKIAGEQNIVQINGKIRSGNDPKSGDEQYELEINETLTVSRNHPDLKAMVKGDLSVSGTSTLGSNLDNNYIFLNGTVQRQDSRALTFASNLAVTENVTVSKNLTVSQSSGLYDVTISNNLTVNKSSSLNDLAVNGNLTVSKSSSLFDVTIRNNLTVSQISNLGDVTIANNLTVSKNSNLNSVAAKSLTLKSGATVNEISTTLSGNSDTAVPTVRAVKEYVDSIVNTIKVVYGG